MTEDEDIANRLLVEQVIAGGGPTDGEDPCKVFVDRYGPVVVRVLRRFRISQQDRDDCWQDVVLKLEDVVADAILEDQLAAGERERARLERMLVQIDHYVEDQILVLRRRRAAIEERIEEAEKRRERAIAGPTRAKDEQTVISLQKEIQRLGERIAILQRGEDADYQAWRDRLFARRFQKPDVERILDVTFTVRNGTGRAC